MATIGGPNTEKDGLVFGYDTGYGVADNNTTTRFYPGKPTTNLLTQNGAQSLDVRTDIYNNTTKTSLGGGKYKFVNDGTGDSTVRLYTNVNDLVDGSTYGCSVSYEEFDPGNGTAVILDWCDNNVTTFSQANYGASNRIFMSGTKPTYNSTYRFLDISLPVNSSIILFDAQVELSTPSPYTDDSRSSTQSLIDLTKTADIDLSNISFDSTGQPTFDGTDDILNTGLFSGRNPSTDPFTIEAIVKSDTTSGSSMWLDATDNGTNQRLYCAHAATGTSTPLGIQNSGWSTSGAVYDTDYHHYVIVMDGSTATLYNNGVSHSTKNYTSYTLSGQLNVGGRSGYRWVGKIPVFKVYNQVLTSDQVKQNYNAYKNRFGI